MKYFLRYCYLKLLLFDKNINNTIIKHLRRTRFMNESFSIDKNSIKLHVYLNGINILAGHSKKTPT